MGRKQSNVTAPPAAEEPAQELPPTAEAVDQVEAATAEDVIVEGFVEGAPAADLDHEVNQAGIEMELDAEAAAFKASLMEDAPEIVLGVLTLAGDVRDNILERLRHEQDRRPWIERSESEQRNTVKAIQNFANQLIRQACDLIAGEGSTTITAKIEQVVVKDEIKATLSVSRHDDNRHALMDAQGMKVLMVVVEAEKHLGERAPVRVMPDQAELIPQTQVVEQNVDNANEQEEAGNPELVEQAEEAAESSVVVIGDGVYLGGLPNGAMVEQAAI